MHVMYLKRWVSWAKLYLWFEISSDLSSDPEARGSGYLGRVHIQVPWLKPPQQMEQTVG